MTPAEHVKRAETFAEKAATAIGQGMTETAKAWAAVSRAHSAIAHAVEAGAPHAGTEQQGS